jgi:hypothetical protein
VPDVTGPATSSPQRPLRTLLPLLIAAAWLAAQIALLTVHEPWRDEGQAWLKAIGLSTPLDFFIVPGEGHPPLWFWLLRLLSLILDFDQARALMIAVAVLNAWLLARLLGDRPLLLVALLLSLPVLHSWGYYFRPYPLILTSVAAALLLDRAGRTTTAAWVLALACGLHILSGWLFAFWLLVLLHRRVPLRTLVAPSLLALAFGGLAVLSGLGNHDGGRVVASIPSAMIHGLYLPFRMPVLSAAPTVAIAAALIGLGLRRSPLLLVGLGGLLLLLAAFHVFTYGLSEWHAAFGLLLVLMAFVVTRAPAWPLLLLLLPQDLLGLHKARLEATLPTAGDALAYAAIAADAGSGLDPARSLVVWPDYLLTATAAAGEFSYLSGNSGALVGAIDWRARRHRDIDAALLATLPTPYWLVCTACRPILAAIPAGRTATRIMPPPATLTEQIAAYRID